MDDRSSRSEASNHLRDPNSPLTSDHGDDHRENGHSGRKAEQAKRHRARGSDHEDYYDDSPQKERGRRRRKSPSRSRSRSRSPGGAKHDINSIIGNYGNAGGNNDPKMPVTDVARKFPRTCVYWKVNHCFNDAEKCNYIHGFVCRDRLDCTRSNCMEVHIKKRVYNDAGGDFRRNQGFRQNTRGYNNQRGGGGFHRGGQQNRPGWENRGRRENFRPNSGNRRDYHERMRFRDQRERSRESDVSGGSQSSRSRERYRRRRSQSYDSRSASPQEMSPGRQRVVARDQRRSCSRDSASQSPDHFTKRKAEVARGDGEKSANESDDNSDRTNKDSKTFQNMSFKKYGSSSPSKLQNEITTVFAKRFPGLNPDKVANIFKEDSADEPSKKKLARWSPVNTAPVGASPPLQPEEGALRRSDSSSSSSSDNGEDANGRTEETDQQKSKRKSKKKKNKKKHKKEKRQKDTPSKEVSEKETSSAYGSHPEGDKPLKGMSSPVIAARYWDTVPDIGDDRPEDERKRKESYDNYRGDRVREDDYDEYKYGREYNEERYHSTPMFGGRGRGRGNYRGRGGYYNPGEGKPYINKDNRPWQGRRPDQMAMRKSPLGRKRQLSDERGGRSCSEGSRSPSRDRSHRATLQKQPHHSQKTSQLREAENRNASPPSPDRHSKEPCSKDLEARSQLRAAEALKKHTKNVSNVSTFDISAIDGEEGLFEEAPKASEPQEAEPSSSIPKKESACERLADVDLTASEEIAQLKHFSKKLESVIDPGMHWCRLCNVFFDKVAAYVAHLFDKTHMAKSEKADKSWYNTPKPAEEDVNEMAKRRQLEGVEHVQTVVTLYCAMCCSTLADTDHMVDHLHSNTHLDAIRERSMKDPLCESKYLQDKMNAFASFKMEQISKPTKEEAKPVGRSAANQNPPNSSKALSKNSSPRNGHFLGEGPRCETRPPDHKVVQSGGNDTSVSYNHSAGEKLVQARNGRNNDTLEVGRSSNLKRVTSKSNSDSRDEDFTYGKVSKPNVVNEYRNASYEAENVKLNSSKARATHKTSSSRMMNTSDSKKMQSFETFTEAHDRSRPAYKSSSKRKSSSSRTMDKKVAAFEDEGGRYSSKSIEARRDETFESHEVRNGQTSLQAKVTEVVKKTEALKKTADKIEKKTKENIERRVNDARQKVEDTLNKLTKPGLTVKHKKNTTTAPQVGKMPFFKAKPTKTSGNEPDASSKTTIDEHVVSAATIKEVADARYVTLPEEKVTIVQEKPVVALFAKPTETDVTPKAKEEQPQLSTGSKFGDELLRKGFKAFDNSDTEAQNILAAEKLGIGLSKIFQTTEASTSDSSKSVIFSAKPTATVGVTLSAPLNIPLPTADLTSTNSLTVTPQAHAVTAGMSYDAQSYANTSVHNAYPYGYPAPAYDTTAYSNPSGYYAESYNAGAHMCADVTATNMPGYPGYMPSMYAPPASDAPPGTSGPPLPLPPGTEVEVGGEAGEQLLPPGEG